jgi:hypothetical protein
MLIFIRYKKNMGDAAVYARFRNATGEFYDLGSNIWRVDEHYDTKIFLKEVVDADPYESTYNKLIVLPTSFDYGVILEAVDSTTSEVISQESLIGYLDHTTIERLRFDGDNNVFASHFSSIILPPLNSAIFSPTVAYGSVIKVVRFDTPELSFNLGSDYSAWDLKLYYREQEGGELKIKDCTWIDGSLGQGSTEFSSLETSELGTYVCELKLLKAGKILTTLKFSLVIYEGLGV